MAGWTLLLDYIFLPLLSYLLIGIYMAEYFPAVHAWVWVLGSIALVTFLNLIGIESITRVNCVLVVAQLVFIVVFVGLSIHNLGTGRAGFAAQAVPPRRLRHAADHDRRGGAVPVVPGLRRGVDHGRGNRQPQVPHPLAIMAVTLFGGLLFLIVSWCAQMVFPEWAIFKDPTPPRWT
jgi:amino acid transporter